MPPFRRPDFDHAYSVEAELAALRRHRDERALPAAGPGRLLLATWNVANLGSQARGDEDYALLAEVIGWFDLTALQEVNDDLSGLRAIQRLLPPSYRLLLSDAAGNRERLAFLYDSARISPLEKVGRLSIPPADLRHVKLPGVEQRFDGFDRGPYLAAFRADGFTFLLLNVHLFFGSERRESVERRMLETFAVARWADLRRRSRHAYTPAIIALGDFNLPQRSPDDPVYRALTSRGLELPAHKSAVGGSSLGGHRHYDQLAFFPGPVHERLAGVDVFDFDNAVFAELYRSHTLKQFLSYVRFHVSDHRPLWAEFHVGDAG